MINPETPPPIDPTPQDAPGGDNDHVDGDKR